MKVYHPLIDYRMHIAIPVIKYERRNNTTLVDIRHEKFQILNEGIPKKQGKVKVL